MAPARASTRRGRSGGASLRESVQSTYSVHSYSASVPSHVSHIPHISSSIFSSAPLPPTYAITLAHTGYPTEAEKEAARTAGTEFVSDAATAAVVSLVALPRRAFRAQLVGSVATADWLTATFAFPCSLDKCAVARTFRTTPPLASALHALDPEEEAANLLPWGTDDGDLDPEMDELPEFESARGWDLEPEPELERESRQPEAPAPQASESTTSSPLFTPAAPTPPTPAKPVTPTHAPPSGPPSSFLVAAAPTPSTPNARRAWWREQSASCGALWRVLPRHTYPSLPCPRNRTADTDEFQLPRNLDAVAHPFHPSIAHYAAVSRARVYWVIPVHGPVVVPGLQDPVVDSDARPWASRGMLDLDSDSDSDAAVNPNTVGEEALSRVRSAQSAARPIPLLWTPALLRAFVSGHFARAWSDPARPYGALHLAVSGPKPDPWLGREMPALGAHEHVPLGLGAGLAPVRPEAGDHVRIYCDASRAMAVRLWLHWWTVGAREVAAYADKHTAGTSAAASVTGSDSEDETVQPFKRARLALVGPRGELLMVA